MKNLWKLSGLFLIITSILHNLVGFIMGWEVLKDIASEGFYNTVSGRHDRNAIFWFIFSGFTMMIIGKMMHDYIKTNNKPLPYYLGIYLLILSITGCIIMPISGFWLVLPQALIIILAARKSSAV